jgi:hypothetical protein
MHISNTSVRINNSITLFKRTTAFKREGNYNWEQKTEKQFFQSNSIAKAKGKKSVYIINNHQFAYLPSLIIPSLY